ncbi:TPA: hypothetical protein ACHFX9_000378 [Citrobacter farmeri]|nr:hypothetical protein [Citrobacter amalonaticus]
MSSKEVIEKIIEDVGATKQQGYESISTDKLLSYLGNLQAHEGYNHDIQMELLRSDNTTNIEIMKMNHASNLEVFRSVITVGANASKAFMIINGGAAIALLAFLGNIWNKESTPTAAASISFSLLLFCLGVLCSGVCSGFTYLAQFCYASSDLAKHSRWNTSGHISNVIAVISGLASLALFAIGAYVTYVSMGNQFISSQ